MTKKRTILFIMGVVCACVLSCAFVFTGCGKNKHDYSVLKYDENGHWYECADDDGETDGYEAHTYDAGTVTKATCTEAGYTTYACTVCGYSYEETNEEAPATGHTLTETEAKDPTCTEDGNIEYWTCSDCGKTFSDAEGKTEVTDVVISATGHSYVESGEAAWTWTETEDGYTVTVKVSCASNDDEKTLDATVTSETDSEGNTVYTATATIGNQTFTATKTVAASTGDDDNPGTGDDDNPNQGSDTGSGSGDDDNPNQGGNTGSGDDDDNPSQGGDTGSGGDDDNPNQGGNTGSGDDDDNPSQGGDTEDDDTVDLEDTVVGVPTEAEFTYSGEKFWNADDLEVVFDENTSTFTVTGTANWMTPEQAAAFGAGAEVGDAYVVIGFDLEVGATISWTSGTTEKTWTKEDADKDLAIVERIWQENQYQIFTITYKGGTTVEFTVSFADVDLPGDAWRVVAIPAGENITYSTGSVTFANETDLEVEFTVETDENGNETLVFTVTGTASKMSGDQAAAFGANAQPYDSYVVIGFYLKDGETLRWTTSLGEEKSSTNNEIAMVERITSAYQCQTFYIYSGENDSTPVCTIKVVFSDLVEGVKLEKRIVADSTLTDIQCKSETFSNGSDVAAAFDEDTTTFTVTGTASTMSSEQAAAFGGAATEEDAYVVIGILLNVGETVEWTTTGGEQKSWTKTNAENDLAIVERISSTTQKQVFTVYDANENEIYTITVVFSDLIEGVELGKRVVGVEPEANIPYGDGETTFSNGSTITIKYDGNESDENTNVFVVSGEATKMTEGQAEAFGAGATVNDYYVVIGFYLNLNETISWTTSLGEEKSWTKTNAEDDLAIVERITGNDQYQIFTITDVVGNTVATIKVVFSDVEIPSSSTGDEGGECGDTSDVPEESSVIEIRFDEFITEEAEEDDGNRYVQFTSDTVLYSEDGTNVTVTATSGKSVQIYENSKSYTDDEGNEVAFKTRLNLMGSRSDSNTTGRYVAITVTETCTVTIYVRGKDAGDVFGFCDSNGNFLTEDGYTYTVAVKDAVEAFEITLEAGTYYLGCSTGGYIYGIDIEYDVADDV